METPQGGAPDTGAAVAAAPTGAAPSAPPPAAPAGSPAAAAANIESGADAFNRAIGTPPAPPAAQEGEPAQAAPEGGDAPQQTELPLTDDEFKSFLEKELPPPAAAPEPAVKPEGLSDDDWTDLQLLRFMRGKDETTAQQLAEARAKILGEPQQFAVTEEAFKAALDGDAATFEKVVNSVVRAGAEHAVQSMLGQVAPYLEKMQAQASTMIYENTKELFCSTVSGADKMRGNPFFEQAIHHIARVAPETPTVQALHRAMELTNKAYADSEAVRRGGGKVHDVRPGGAGGAVQGGARQGQPEPQEVDPYALKIARAFGLPIEKVMQK